MLKQVWCRLMQIAGSACKVPLLQEHAGLPTWTGQCATDESLQESCCLASLQAWRHDKAQVLCGSGGKLVLSAYALGSSQ